MQSTAAPDVYFTLDGQGVVTAIKMNDEEIIERKVFSQSQLLPSWVNALHEMRASLETNAVDPCGIPLPPHGDRAVQFDSVSLAGADGEHVTELPCMQGLLQSHLNPSVPLGVGATAVESGVDFPFDIFHSANIWDDVDALNLPFAPAFVENTSDTSISAGSRARDSLTNAHQGSQPMGLKRAQKLHRMLHALESRAVLSQEEHNRQVEGLYNGPQLPECSSGVSMVQFAAVLGRHSSVSVAVGTIYGLLSWNIFGLEEDRLIREERMSPYIASKQMNQKMTSTLHRRGKSNDWASDGRRAAKAVFGALKGINTQGQSFALILLAELFSLDYLLKIAHFPALRISFQEQFARIIRSRNAEWSLYLERGYKVFDYQLFLSLKSHSIPGQELAN